VALSCRLLGVSRSGYYAWRGPAGPDGRWRGRAPSPRARGDGALTSEIRRIHADSRGTYGSPRVHAELCFSGVRVGRRRVACVLFMHRRGWSGATGAGRGRSRRPATRRHPQRRTWWAAASRHRRPIACGWRTSSATRRSQPCGDERTPPAARRSEPMKLRAARPIGTGGVGGQQP